MKCNDCGNLGWGNDEGELVYGWCKVRQYCPDLGLEKNCSSFIKKRPDALAALQTENAKLRAELEKAQYERDYPCIYFKAGGLCRYGGDESEANICVMGPCDCEMTAADVDRLRSELEQVNMERYTYFDGGKWRMRIGDTEYSGKAIDRLAAYEDTGLEPEDLRLAFDEYLMRVLFEDWKDKPQCVTADRLRELAQADREGRCVVLPKADRSSYISIADLLSDDLTDWIHDPSVGLYGPNGEEAAIMRCFITALEGMKNG